MTLLPMVLILFIFQWALCVPRELIPECGCALRL